MDDPYHILCKKQKNEQRITRRKQLAALYWVGTSTNVTVQATPLIRDVTAGVFHPLSKTKHLLWHHSWGFGPGRPVVDGLGPVENSLVTYCFMMKWNESSETLEWLQMSSGCSGSCCEENYRDQWHLMKRNAVLLWAVALKIIVPSRVTHLKLARLRASCSFLVLSLLFTSFCSLCWPLSALVSPTHWHTLYISLAAALPWISPSVLSVWVTLTHTYMYTHTYTHTRNSLVSPWQNHPGKIYTATPPSCHHYAHRHPLPLFFS